MSFFLHVVGLAASVMFPTAAEPVPAQAVNVTPAQSVPAPTLQPAVVETTDDDDAPATYATLSAAVAAQHGHALDELSERDLECLASGIYFESKSEPLAGQLAVAETILNRTRSGRFPKTVCQVLTQRGQFSFVRGGVVPTAEGRPGWTTALAVAKVAARDLWASDAEDALFFHARRASPGWRLQKVASIGNHVFYR